MSFSGRFKKGSTSTSSLFSTYLRHAKSVFFQRKITVFEGSASILSLTLSPPFSSLMRSQNPLKMSSKSSSEGYRIQHRFKKGFKITSKLVFEASGTPQTAPKSHPKLVQDRIPAWVQRCFFELVIKTLFEALLDPFGGDFGPHLEPNLSSFEANLSSKTVP